MSFQGPQGVIKISLKSKALIGIAQSRGERPYQEDTYVACSIDVPAKDLRLNLRDSQHRDASTWRAKSRGNTEKEQVVFVGCFDGHGGDGASKLLRDKLPEMIEEAAASDVQELLDSYKAIGGYMRRHKNDLLERHTGEDSSDMALDERAAFGYIKADQLAIADESVGNAGSTATSVMLYSLDSPPTPFFGASRLSLTVAHVGDTRAMLVSQRSGRVQALTVAHHADSRVEAERLRRTGTGLVTDSFGESRWGGALANTRAIGDKRFKRLGVVGDPDISKRVLEGGEWAAIILVSDGVSGAISDQEIADLCRSTKNPTQAAEQIVSFAEQVGAEDNCTAVVVPLPGWQKLGGTDSTLARREYRLRQASTSSSRQRRQ